MPFSAHDEQHAFFGLAAEAFFFGEVLLQLDDLSFEKLSLIFFGDEAVLSADLGLPDEFCDAVKSEEP